MNKWCVIEPLADGYIGVSKAGTIVGKDRWEVIKRLIEITFNEDGE